jgi:predicted MFS family arabinose efflux permease
VAGTASQALAPAFGLWLWQTTGSFALVFVLGGLCGLAALVVLLTQVPRVGQGKTTFRGALAWPREGVSLSSFVDTRVLLASMLLVCLTLTSPVTFAFVPLHAYSLGITNISFYFLASGFTSVGMRLLVGHYLDRGGRGWWIVSGYALLALAFASFTQARGVEGFILAAVLSAAGTALAQPTLMALAIDRAAPGRLGKAMATYSMFFRVGEGLGAPVAGALIVHFGYTGMYLGAMAIVLVGIVLSAINWGTIGRRTHPAAA